MAEISASGQKLKRGLGKNNFAREPTGFGSASPPSAGWQLKFGIRVFLKIGSDFIQQMEPDRKF